MSGALGLRARVPNMRPATPATSGRSVARIAVAVRFFLLGDESALIATGSREQVPD
jgi:hypothetical protein